MPRKRTRPLAATIADTNDAEARRRLDVLGTDATRMKANGWDGSTLELVDQDRKYAELGSDRTYRQIQDLTDPHQIELEASEIVPQLS